MMKSFLRSTLDFYETEKMVLYCSLLLASMMKRCASVIIVDSIWSSTFRFSGKEVVYCSKEVENWKCHILHDKRDMLIDHSSTTVLFTDVN